MTNNSQSTKYNVPNEEEGSLFNIDLKKLFRDVVKYWWLFLLMLIVSGVGVKAYLHFKKPVYSASLTLIIDADASSQTSLQNSANSLITGTLLSPMMRNLDNQVEILSSMSMTRRVINSMNLCVSYYKIGRVREAEIYKSSPFVVVFDSTHCQPLNTRILLTTIDNEHFTLEVDADQINTIIYSRNKGGEKFEHIKYKSQHSYGEAIVTPWCAFSVNKRQTEVAPNENFQENEEEEEEEIEEEYNDKYCVIFRSLEDLTLAYRKATKVSKAAGKQNESSVLTISTLGTCQLQILDYLNQTAATFINDNLEQKNLVADNTIKFINEQLMFLGDTLYNIGSQLSAYRVEHGLEQDAKVKSSQIFQDIKKYDEDIEQQKIYLSYYDYLERYFGNDSVMQGVIAPAFLDTKSTSIITQLNDIMKLSAERHTYEETYGRGDNPVGKQLTAKLYIARNMLLNSINNHRSMIGKHIDELNAEYEKATHELMKLPEAERVLLNIDRQYTLNNDVFNFLMRKRSESQIQKASNTPDHKVLDKASISGIVSPNAKTTYILGILLALALPMAFLIIRQLVDDKIRNEEDLDNLTQHKIIGNVPNNNKGEFLLFDAPRSYIAECIRRIRNKLNFYAHNGKLSILVSSSDSGEGKTFTSINIASAFAISGKKTVLLGYDLRKPGLNRFVEDGDSHLGLSNYIIGDCSKKDIIINVKPNLDVILSGDVPPNPAELISQEASTSLIEEVRQEYDVVVIDTPPLGVVGDAISLFPFADVVTYIVRQDYTNKNLLKETLELLSDEKMPNLTLILNDINSKNSRYGHNGSKRYGYGYGYLGKHKKRRNGYYYTEDNGQYYTD